MLSKRLSSFFRRQDGGVTVEMVLWLPVMFAAIMVPVDGTLLMFEKTNLYDIARDSSRQVALGYKTPEEAEEAVLSVLEDGVGYTASIEQSNGFVTATISVPFNSILLFGGPFADDEARIVSSITMLEENNGNT